MSRNLKGKVAIVTGASSGIGKAIALALADIGVKVGIAAPRKEELDKVVCEIQERGGQATAVQTDVTVRAQMKNLSIKTRDAFGPIDILVNNAGIWRGTMMKNVMEDAWNDMVEVNVKGYLNGIGAVLESMVERKTGHIVTISSDLGKMGVPGLAVYCGTKFFIEGTTQAMRKELVEHGIRLTNIQPGDVNTPGTLEIFEKETEKLLYPNPDDKVLVADDVARAVVYAVTQPDYVAVNEILVQPSSRPL